MTPALQMRKLMFRIFAAPPEVSVCPFIQFLWKYLLLFGEENPFPQGLQTKASFSERCYLCCITSQLKRGAGNKSDYYLLRFCGWLAQPRLGTPLSTFLPVWPAWASAQQASQGSWASEGDWLPQSGVFPEVDVEAASL